MRRPPLQRTPPDALRRTPRSTAKYVKGKDKPYPQISPIDADYDRPEVNSREPKAMSRFPSDERSRRPAAPASRFTSPAARSFPLALSRLFPLYYFQEDATDQSVTNEWESDCEMCRFDPMSVWKDRNVKSMQNRQGK
jgi:hypothetical protein